MARNSSPKAKPRRRNASVQHKRCSEKRTLLKERIRSLEGQIESLLSEQSIVDIRFEAINEVIKILVAAAGIKASLDPFGAALSNPGTIGEKVNKPS